MRTKILLSFAILICAAITAHAQINKGRYLLGGSISLSNYTTNQSTALKDEEVSTNIQFGKVIKDNTVVGIIVSYGYNKMPQYKSNQYNAGIFYRKYKSIAKNLYFFGEVGAEYSNSKSTQGDLQIGSDGIRNSGNGGTLYFIPGISYSICKRMQMEVVIPSPFSLFYGGSKNESTDIGNATISSSKTKGFSATINLNSTLLSNFGIGFKFLLGK